MEMLLQIVLLALGFVMLVKGANWFVDGASNIAAKFKIPQLVIGLTIVAMGTSSPEAAVSITAALHGNAEITIGNVMGSNILNILLILGLSASISRLAVAKSTVWIEIPFLLLVSGLLYVQGLDGTISLLDGAIQLLLFAAYLTYLLIMAKKFPDENPKTPKQMKLWKAILATVGGLAMVIVGSDLAVDASTTIARIMGLSERFIGLTVVALGTSLPELFTSAAAARKGNADIAIGNIVGSNVFNTLFVVGLSALITPVPFAADFLFDTVIAAGAALLLWVCCMKDKSLKRWHGILMLLSYAAYFAVII